MADFITRLAERALGVAPAVQPVMPPIFAPEPVSDSTSLEWEREATTPSDDLVRPRGPSVEERPPAREAPPAPRADAALAHQKGQSGDALSPAVPESPRRTPESRPGPAHLGGSGSSERGAMTGKEDQRSSSRTTAKNPRIPPGARSEPLRRTGPGPARRGLPLGPSSVENESGEAVFRPVGTLLDRGQEKTLPSAPSSGAVVSLDASENAPPPVEPHMIRPRLDGYFERGPQEPQVAPPESSTPAIRVTIGRIEVRVITPPHMPPAQRTASARPAPALSLDDYLEQRNGG